jgi:hypothetical protein
MDIKIGKVTCKVYMCFKIISLNFLDDPDATEEKRIKEQSKSPFQKLLGFRILGYRVLIFFNYYFLIFRSIQKKSFTAKIEFGVEKGHWKIYNKVL